MEDERPRTIDNICQGTEYKMTLLGNDYCKLDMHTDKTRCPYLNRYKDENGFRKCLYEVLRR